MTRSADDVERALQLRQLIERGLSVFLRTYLDGATRLHHPGYLAHQVAVPDVPAAPAGLIHGVTNRPTAICEMGAAGASVERAVLTWMAETLGFDARRGGGVLAHGGSPANLNALPPAITPTTTRASAECLIGRDWRARYR
jgi:L-2,4-diaminobutyrate decarboxylase